MVGLSVVASSVLCTWFWVLGTPYLVLGPGSLYHSSVRSVLMWYPFLSSEVTLAMLLNSKLLSCCACCCLSISLLTLSPCAAPGQESYKENPGTEGNGNVVVGPDYKIDPDLTDRGNPKGKYFEFAMRLADSKIFRGDDVTLDPKKPVRTERKIFVYVPAAYKDGTKAPILITLDGPGRLNLVRNALDNLTISADASRKLPAFIAIGVENGGNDSKGSERGLEYDTLSDRHARFLNDEVLPAVLSNPEIKAAYPKIAFTTNPWGKAVMGCSSGGAAALTAGWFRPDLFRRLITYSGTFVDQQDDDAPEEKQYPLGAWDYHSGLKLIEKSEKKPLRIFTHVSENDNRAKDPEETYHNWVMANERTAAALKAKGYDYRFVFSKATRHCDPKVFELTLADALVWTWRGYHAE
jgi:enterochelin esterase-like enzyme